MVLQLNFFDRLPISLYEKKVTIDIIGIINGPICEQIFNTGSIKQRIPVILPDYTQCLLEIWTPKNCKPAKFDKNWRNLQLTIITGLVHVGNILFKGKVVKVLRQPMFKAKKNRMIWISGQNFWDYPILTGPTLSNHIAGKDWPFPMRLKKEGYLNTSKGSIKTEHWAKIFPRIHSSITEPYEFRSILAFHTKVRKSLHGFMNLSTMVKDDPWLIFER